MNWEDLPERCPGGSSSPLSLLAYSEVCYHPVFGYHGGQSELSSDANKVVLCSALRPAQHVSAAMRHLPPDEADLLLGTDQWEGGGEDWPDAYHCSMSEAQSLCCVVAWWHCGCGGPAYQVCSGLLFRLPLAVTSFNGRSRFTEAVVGCRLTCTMVYFDDAHVTDLSSAKGSGQHAFSQVNHMMGPPFTERRSGR